MSGFGKKARVVQVLSVNMQATKAYSNGNTHHGAALRYRFGEYKGQPKEIDQFIFQKYLDNNPAEVAVLQSLQPGEIVELTITTAPQKASMFNHIERTSKPYGTETLLESADGTPPSQNKSNYSKPQAKSTFNEHGMQVGNAIHGATRLVAALINAGHISNAAEAHAAVESTVSALLAISNAQQNNGAADSSTQPSSVAVPNPRSIAAPPVQQVAPPPPAVTTTTPQYVPGAALGVPNFGD